MSDCNIHDEVTKKVYVKDLTLESQLLRNLKIFYNKHRFDMPTEYRKIISEASRIVESIRRLDTGW